MERAGFECLAAVDFNPEAIAVFQKNFTRVPQVLARDLTKFPPAAMAKLLGTDSVDVIAGGPPCQGFSTVRQRDGANHGAERFVQDSRRQLYGEFLRYVEFFQPRVFVMENVLGIQSAARGEYFTRVQHEARLLGYRVVWVEEDSRLGRDVRHRGAGLKEMPDIFPKAKRSAVKARMRGSVLI